MTAKLSLRSNVRGPMATCGRNRPPRSRNLCRVGRAQDASTKEVTHQGRGFAGAVAEFELE